MQAGKAARYKEEAPGQARHLAVIKRDAAAKAERMCLWKVECKLLHPVTGSETVHVQIDDPDLFALVLQEHSTDSDNV